MWDEEEETNQAEPEPVPNNQEEEQEEWDAESWKDLVESSSSFDRPCI